MTNVCCYGFSNRTGALLILQMSVLIGLYLLLREIVEQFLKPRGVAAWKIWYLFLSPVIEICITCFGIYAIKKTKPGFLLPILFYKLIYIILYLVILFSLPVALSFVSSDHFISEMKAQFNMDGNNVVDTLLPIPMALMMVFISTLLFPMEELLRMSKTVIISVYTIYLFFVTSLQIYFMLVLYIQFKDMIKEIEESQVQRYVVQPVPGVTTYSAVPEGNILSKVPVNQRTYVNIDHRKFPFTVPNSSSIN